MNIIPAIDLKKGECVRLLRGDFTEITRYNSDPIACAKQYKSTGADQLHLVDLDGAENRDAKQTQLITDIAKNGGIEIQTGGGIRSAKQIEMLLKNDIQRVVIGSLAVKQPLKVQEWIEIFGNDRIVIALDVRLIDGEYYCTTNAWKNTENLNLWACLDYFNDLKFLLCTDIDRDGSLSGPNIHLYKKIKENYPNIHLQASGGISSLDDLRRLAELKVDSVIIGKALYEKRFTLSEAMSLCEEISNVM